MPSPMEWKSRLHRIQTPTRGRRRMKMNKKTHKSWTKRKWRSQHTERENAAAKSIRKVESLRLFEKRKKNPELIITWRTEKCEEEKKKHTISINHITFWKSIFQPTEWRKRNAFFKVIHVWHRNIKASWCACNVRRPRHQRRCRRRRRCICNWFSHFQQINWFQFLFVIVLSIYFTLNSVWWSFHFAPFSCVKWRRYRSSKTKKEMRSNAWW